MVRKEKIEVLQTKNNLIINDLECLSFAGSFAKILTLISGWSLHRLPNQNIITPFANEKRLIFNSFSNSRLRNCLQIYQLSTSTSLQVQAVLFAVCKEQTAINQRIHPNILASNLN